MSNALDMRGSLMQIINVELFRDLEHTELVGIGELVGFDDVNPQGMLHKGQAPLFIEVDVVLGEVMYETQLGFIKFFNRELM